MAAGATGGSAALAGAGGGAAATSAVTGGSGPGAGGAAGRVGTGGSVDGGASHPDASPSDGAAPDASVPGQGISSIFKICGLSPGGVCDGINAYAACVQSACGSALTQCFGPGNARDEFTGGACATYADCVTSAADSCHSSCAPSGDCQSCLGGLTACLQGSPCTAPRCNGPTGGQDGGAPRDGGVPIGGTCDDLDACCAAISDTPSRDACNATLADARARGGDADCAVVFSTYKSAGICK